jgi:hypothetical protein
MVDGGAHLDDLMGIKVLFKDRQTGEMPMVSDLRTSGIACGPVSHWLSVGFHLIE